MASCCSREYTSSFQEALTYAQEMLGCPELALKEEQKLAIHAIYSGSDVFVWLPTGFGKSMCFHTLPFVFDYKLELVSASKRSVVVVVAPLVALMVDQVQSLRAKGVEAAIVSSGGREGRVAGDLLTSDFQSLISSSLALIEVSVELCQGLVLFKFLLSSGDSPMLPCWTKEHLAKVLNLESSVAAFSRKEIFDWQLSQMKEGNWSSGAGCGTPRSLPILPANCCFIPGC